MSRLRLILLSLFSSVLLAATPVLVYATSNADLQSQINALNAKLVQNQKQLNQITAQANTLANKLSAINAQIAEYQSQIDLSNLQIKQTQAKINDAANKLEQEKQIMFENARTLYKLGDPSPIEILASSDTFTDFINRQEYLTTVKESVNQAAAQILALKSQLEAHQKDLQNYVSQQKVQQQLVVEKRNEQAQLLAETKGEESRYQHLVAQNKAAVQAAQNELNARLAQTGQTDFGTGSYPYPSACGNPYPAPWDPAVDSCPTDSGGYIQRQCTSFAYWRRNNMVVLGETHSSSIPGFWGNAGDWPYSAGHAGYTVNYTPEVGAIGVIPGTFGHVFIVEQVIDSTHVWASQYNFSGANGGAWGKYSYVEFNTSGLQFIH